MATTKKRSAKKPAAKKSSAKKKVAAKPKVARKTPAKKAATKKPVVRRASSISPQRGANVDEWAKKLTGWQADALRIIRALVARHAPGATLAMKWGQPVWEQNGPFAWLRPAAKHVSFGFWRGAEMNDPDGHLEGAGDRMRHLKVSSAADLKSLPIEGFVKQAVALNGSKGDPTRRR